MSASTSENLTASAREEHFSTNPSEQIAIVGMSCRWPGGASDVSKLWDLLASGENAYSDFPSNKVNLDGFYHPSQNRPGSFYTRGGYFLRDDPKKFDHAFFGVTPLETATMDPAHRKLLEITYEAFESAGETWESFTGSRTGVFVGNFNFDHQLMQMRDLDQLMPYATTGGDVTILSNRINYIFNLRGPSVTLDTACSSSLYALHMAVQSIKNDDCDSAIVAGSNLILGPEAQLLTTKLGAISPTSTCHTFDAAADGYARAEGLGALYIKKVKSAIARDEPIRAVIRGTAINANGRTSGITHPSLEGQESVIKRAYKNAGNLDPSLTGYFECHGTGTPVGDPIEVSAIGRVFAPGRHLKEPLLVGSIKTNLGHSESASGIAGVMKAVLAMEHAMIPPTVGVKNLNPGIDFQAANVKVVTELMPWPNKPIRRASVNSFGYGGANAHCIVDHPSSVILGYLPWGRTKASRTMKSLACEPPQSPQGRLDDSLGSQDALNHDSVNTRSRPFGPKSASLISDNPSGLAKSRDNILGSLDHPRYRSSAVRRLVLLPFSACNEASLTSNIAEIVHAAPFYEIGDIAYTLAARRSHFMQRAFAIEKVKSKSCTPQLDLVTYGRCSLEKTNPSFVFTGQGAQWVGMGFELFVEYQAFRDSIQYQDEILAKLSNRPTWSIREFFTDPEAARKIDEPQVSQTVCTALQMALVDLMRSWNIRPTACVGHSSGEIATAYAAGFHTAAEAIVLAFLRGKVVSSNERKGAMIAVGLGLQELAPYLDDVEPDVKIAAVNSPTSMTLSGEAGAVTRIQKQLEQNEKFVRTLKTGGNAYHSHHMLALGQAYELLVRQAFEEIADDIAREMPMQSLVTWVSSVTPRQETMKTELGPHYWRKNMESPVLFSEAIEVLADKVDMLHSTLCEIGPHPALSGPLKQIRAVLRESVPECVPTLLREQDGLANMLTFCGKLYLKNVAINVAAVNAVDCLQDGFYYRAFGSLCVDLPHYKYHCGKVHYHENRYNREWRLRKHLRHDILGAKQAGYSKLQPKWRNVLRLKHVPWLRDHQLIPHPVFPAAGYLTMAIEAVMQIHEEDPSLQSVAGFEFRDVAIKAAMPIPDDELGVETNLSLQPVSMTYHRGSLPWYKFSVSSATTSEDYWTEHCIGTVKVEENEEREPDFELCDKRAEPVSTESWYQKFAEAGLGYGPVFQGMSELSAVKIENTSYAMINFKPLHGTLSVQESRYPVHPATLDALFQLALVSCHAGRLESFENAFVPVFAESISVRLPKPADCLSDRGFATATGQLRGLRGAHASTKLTGDTGRTLVEINGARFLTYNGSPNSPMDTESLRDPYMRLVWKPDILSLGNRMARNIFTPMTDPIYISGVFDKLDRLSTYVLVDIHSNSAQIFTGIREQHLHRFVTWIQQCMALAKERKLTRHSAEALNALPSDRRTIIQRTASELQNIVEARLIYQIYENLPKFFAGETSGLEVALRHDLFSELYVSGIGMRAAYAQLLHIIDLLAHHNPRMEILEIGAGTGGATRQVVGALCGSSGWKTYAGYTFTDVSKSFLSAAQSEFWQCIGMSFQTLDIEQDPREQGFLQQYDLVIASQVLHATTPIAQTLKNVRSLLNPGGKLLLLELTRTILGAGLALGTFPDYWKGTNDGRGEGPLIDCETWHNLLAANGFSGLDLVLDDHEGSLAMASVMLSTADEPAQVYSGESLRSTIYLVYRKNLHPLAEAMQKLSLAEGTVVSFASLTDVGKIPLQSRVISLIDVESSTLIDGVDSDFEAVKCLFGLSSSMLWISQGEPVSGSRPESAVIVGMLRAIATEMPECKFMHIGLHADFVKDLEGIAQIVIRKEKELQRSHMNALRDGEYVLRNGCLHISRLMPNETLTEHYKEREGLVQRRQTLPMNSQGPIGLRFDQKGFLSSMFFDTDPKMLEPLRDDSVEIETKAIGLNMKDLAVAMGKFDWDYLSTECAGVVIRIGPSVRSFQVGDRVFGAAPGKMGNYVRASATALHVIPSTLNFGEVASIPVAYMTAIYALNHLARLHRGETVLIQSATGGLGLAAMRIARHLGAEIYATVGNEEKAQVLQGEFDIPKERIFSSRDVSACTKLMKTSSRGVDVILCSAAGEYMREMLRCLAPAGRFIEVGRTDVLDRGEINLGVFERNATFSSFDLGLLNLQKPKLIARLMSEVVELYDQGIVRPVERIQTFDISRLEEGMMYFSKGMHIGKVIISFQNPETLLRMKPKVASASFDSKGNYLMVGCLGGLGQVIARYMIERGARHLTFLSRSGASSPDAELAFLELRRQGIDARIVHCDITVKEELQNAVDQACSEQIVKGIVHAAMIEKDAPFTTTSFQQLQSVLAPKVIGTINLHSCTLHLPLSFFLMTSSIVALLGTATQSTYAAANAFLDAFARFHVAQSLPAQSIALGAIDDAGYLCSRPEVQKALLRNSIYGTSSAELLRLLEAAFLTPYAAAASNENNKFDALAMCHLITGLEPSKLAELYKTGLGTGVAWHADARFSGLLQAVEDQSILENQSRSPDKVIPVTDRLRAASEADDKRRIIMDTLKERLAKLLFIEKDEICMDKAMTDYGVDSMVAAELRNWCIKAFEADVPFLELSGEGTRINDLVEKIMLKREPRK